MCLQVAVVGNLGNGPKKAVTLASNGSLSTAWTFCGVGEH